MTRHRGGAAPVLAAICIAAIVSGCAREGRGHDPRQERAGPIAWTPLPDGWQWQDTLAPVRAVREAAGASRPRIIEGYAWVTLAGRRFLLVRGESTHGTNFYQTAFFVFDRSGERYRPSLTALASEEYTPGRPMGGTPYRINGCLFVAGPDALGYDVRSTDPAQASADTQAVALRGTPVARRPGIYRVSGDGSLSYSGPLGAGSGTACAPAGEQRPRGSSGGRP